MEKNNRLVGYLINYLKKSHVNSGDGTPFVRLLESAYKEQPEPFVRELIDRLNELRNQKEQYDKEFKYTETFSWSVKQEAT